MIGHLVGRTCYSSSTVTASCLRKTTTICSRHMTSTLPVIRNNQKLSNTIINYGHPIITQSKLARMLNNYALFRTVQSLVRKRSFEANDTMSDIITKSEFNFTQGVKEKENLNISQKSIEKIQ
ncbi:unnamed protein product, partial [Didymodactylos carnosus]